MSSDVPAGLLFEAPPEVPKTFNTLLYGPPKCGKSTAAATAPGPILWVNAEGPNALDFARKVATERGSQILEVRFTRTAPAKDKLRQVLQYVLGAQEPRPQTVVVDTLAKIREALIREIVVPGAKNSLQQYGDVAKILGDFVNVLRDAPVNMVLIAHQNVSDVEGDRIVEPLIGGALTNVIPGEVDVLAYCGRVKNDDGVRYVAQLVEGRGRNAGDRSGALGEVRDLDLTEWLSAYRAGLTPDESDLPFSEDFNPDEIVEEITDEEPKPKAKRAKKPTAVPEPEPDPEPDVLELDAAA